MLDRMAVKKLNEIGGDLQLLCLLLHVLINSSLYGVNDSRHLFLKFQAPMP